MEASAINHNVYYQGIYWNDYAVVRAELNRRATGSAATTWHEHFRSSTKPKFKKALIINCGNGWVERDMFDRGMFEEAVAFDASDVLLQQSEANRCGRPIRYQRIDSNKISPESIGQDYDLIVNYAACHHVGRLFRFMRVMSEVIVPDGVMVNWDYIGPDRNQYPYELWEQVYRCNDNLPITARAELIYPHLPTMLATDPSEAIRSSLILPAFRRYFTMDHLAMLGGGIAYPIVTHNQALAEMDITQSQPLLERLLSEDEVWCNNRPEHNLFSYWWGKPQTALSDTRDTATMEQFEASWFNDHSELFPPHELTLIQRLTQLVSDLRLGIK